MKQLARVLDVAIAVTVTAFLALLAGPATLALPVPMNVVGSLTKLTFLFVAFHLASRNAARFESGTPVRRAWRLLSLGALGYFLGQLSLAPYQLAGGSAPFPSIGDVFFVLGYPLFILSLVSFKRAYEVADYLPDAGGGRRLAWGLGLASVPVAYVTLSPILRTPAPLLVTSLNVTYLVLDLLLFIPAALLIRLTLPLRGGEVGRAWVVLLAGFVSICVGDVLFAYLSTLGQIGLDPLVHATYIAGYGLLARGVLRHGRVAATDMASAAVATSPV